MSRSRCAHNGRARHDTAMTGRRLVLEPAGEPRQTETADDDRRQVASTAVVRPQLARAAAARPAAARAAAARPAAARHAGIRAGGGRAGAPGAAAGAERRHHRGRARPPRRRPSDADRQRPRYPPARGLWLRPPDRLRPQSRAATRPRQGGRRRGRARLHLPPPRGPPLVGRGAVHDRGFPLLVGGHGQQPPPQPGRAAARAGGRGRAAQGRDPRPADRALQLVEAQPVLPAGAGRSARRCSSTRRRTTSSSSTRTTPIRPSSPD